MLSLQDVSALSVCITTNGKSDICVTPILVSVDAGSIIGQQATERSEELPPLQIMAVIKKSMTIGGK